MNIMCEPSRFSERISGTFQIPVDSFQETSGKTRAVATKTVNYFCPVLKGAGFPF
jgi:hypothetical protein